MLLIVIAIMDHLTCPVAGAEDGPQEKLSDLVTKRRRKLLMSARASLLDVNLFEMDSDVDHVLTVTDAALDHVTHQLRHWELLQQTFKISSMDANVYR